MGFDFDVFVEVGERVGWFSVVVGVDQGLIGIFEQPDKPGEEA